jgi:hypothetical protein
MTRQIALGPLFAIVVIWIAHAHAAELTTFTSEQEAQRHCPADTVVWLNLPIGLYHLKGERWYGRTKHGAFVCEKEAGQAADRASRNSQ